MAVSRVRWGLWPWPRLGGQAAPPRLSNNIHTTCINSRMSKALKRFVQSPFLQGFLRGLGVSAELYAVHVSPPPIRSVADAFRADRDALRSDWLKIGGDFRRVIEREYGEVAH